MTEPVSLGDQAIMRLIDAVMLSEELPLEDFRRFMSAAYTDDGVSLTCEQLASMAGEIIGATLRYLLDHDGYLERCR